MTFFRKSNMGSSHVRKSNIQNWSPEHDDARDKVNEPMDAEEQEDEEDEYSDERDEG